MKLAGLAILSLSFLAACQNTAVPPQVALNLKTVQSEIVQGRAALIDVGDAAKALRDAKPADLPVLFRSYKAKLAALDAQASGVRRSAASSAEKSDAYFAKWEKDIDQLSDDATRSSATERRQQAQSAYREAKAKVASLRGSFGPYMATLKDIDGILTSDLTPAGLKTAKASLDRAVERHPAVLREVDQVIEAINKVQP